MQKTSRGRGVAKQVVQLIAGSAAFEVELDGGAIARAILERLPIESKENWRRPE